MIFDIDNLPSATRCHYSVAKRFLQCSTDDIYYILVPGITVYVYWRTGISGSFWSKPLYQDDFKTRNIRLLWVELKEMTLMCQLPWAPGTFLFAGNRHSSLATDLIVLKIRQLWGLRHILSSIFCEILCRVWIAPPTLLQISLLLLLSIFLVHLHVIATRP